MRDQLQKDGRRRGVGLGVGVVFFLWPRRRRRGFFAAIIGLGAGLSARLSVRLPRRRARIVRLRALLARRRAIGLAHMTLEARGLARRVGGVRRRTRRRRSGEICNGVGRDAHKSPRPSRAHGAGGKAAEQAPGHAGNHRNCNKISGPELRLMCATGKRRRAPGSFCLLSAPLARHLRAPCLTGARGNPRKTAVRGEKVCCFKRLAAHSEPSTRSRAAGKFGRAPGALCRARARDLAQLRPSVRALRPARRADRHRGGFAEHRQRQHARLCAHHC